MPGFRSLATAATAALVLVGGAGPAGAADGLWHRTLFRFQDPRVVESSGLVDRGPDVATINDSGDGPYVYLVDKRSGRTVGVTTYASGAVRDVEALAPGGQESVWVGDIGDNTSSRAGIAVYHVPRLRAGDRTVAAPRYRLAYPDGAHDAETLLVAPGSGRLFVVTKTVFGGTVYAAPARLRTDRVNRLRRYATVPGLVTDGGFLPDGRHLLLRTYGTVTAYTFPGFHLLDTATLPAERQGEGLAVAGRGRVLLSSEGEHSAVLRVRLPAGLAARTRPASPASPSTPSPARSQSSAAEHGAGPGIRGGLGVGLVALTLAALGYLALRAARRRGPRTR